MQFSGLASTDFSGGTAANMLYYGGPIGLVAGLITQGAIEKHQQKKQKQLMQDEADRVLVPYQPTLSRFYYAELMQRALDALSTDGSRVLLKNADPPGAGLTIECMPSFFMTHGASALVLINPILIHGANTSAKTPPMFKNVVKVVAAPRPPQEVGQEDSWISDQGAELKLLAVEELRESLNLALTEAVQGFPSRSAEFKNVRYKEGDSAKIEHAQVLTELPGHLVLKTLRGWIMSVPVMPAGGEEP
ncbi:MAG TPA: hypothetical protein VGJ20_29000 [Xanthobacteraceae bacterium]